jgi:hypothetical protein
MGLIFSAMEKSMSDMIQLVPNKWVSEKVLMAITGLTKTRSD